MRDYHALELAIAGCIFDAAAYENAYLNTYTGIAASMMQEDFDQR